jgi:prepilin-type N-terminal cleavage/methylation domain-containing protein
MQIQGDVMKKNNGFTLIELMIVLSIISILVLVSVPKLNSVKKNAADRKVDANVYIVKAFLEDRRFGDKGTIVELYDNQKQPLGEVLKAVQNNIGKAMELTFTASRSIENPYSGSSSISYTVQNIESNTENASVVVSGSTGSLPQNENSIVYPVVSNWRIFSGKVIVIVYNSGYIGFGVNENGTKVKPFVIKMPSEQAFNIDPVPPPVTEPPDVVFDPIAIMNDMINGPINVIGSFDKNVNINLNSPPAGPPARAYYTSSSSDIKVTGPVYLQGKYIKLESTSNITGNLKVLANYINLSNYFNVYGNADFIGKQKVFINSYLSYMQAPYVQSDGDFESAGFFFSGTNNELQAAVKGIIKNPYGSPKIKNVQAKSNYEGKTLFPINMTKAMQYDLFNLPVTYNSKGDRFAYNWLNDVAFVRMSSAESSSITFSELDEKMSINQPGSSGDMSGTVKILFVDGDYTITHKSNKSISTGNWFIYCTGTLNISNKQTVELQNSSLYCREATITSPSFEIELVGGSMKSKYLSKITEYFTNFLAE